MKILKRTLAISILSVLTAISILGCSNTNKGDGVTLKIEELPLEGTTGSTDNGQTLGTGDGVLNALFTGTLGVPVSYSSMSNIAADPTGFTVSNDWDADGIPNDQEVTTNPYAADYPRILTRVTTPITMELRVSETNSVDNLTEVVNKTDTKDTISNSMEDKHYTQANMKTTPYVTKEAASDAGSNSKSLSVAVSAEVNVGVGGAKASVSVSESLATSFSKSNSSEKTVFQDVDYTDNLDKNGVEFTNNKVQNMAKNYRQSNLSKSTTSIDPNAGLVRAGLFLKNDSINMPVKVSEVVCTLSFRTPAGSFLPVKTFKLRNEDYSEFNEEIYGAEELGPYTIEISGLNTHEVKNALANGYVPQIHVVSYKMSRVRDSNYNPGYENLKIVEETAKGRTAQIKIIGPNKRDIYRVAAFDVDSSGRMIPGISLKKALYNILHDRIGNGESWTSDNNGKELTVTDANLKWMAKLDAQSKPVPANLKNTEHSYSGNIKGNTWRKFETYVKTWVDEFNVPHKIETIKRIDDLNQYNPFSAEDNPSYNPNELLSETEVNKFKFWTIYHNGRYFEGDLNDPIWAGERFEIVLMDTRDFNTHFENYYYTPLQSVESFVLTTPWNINSNNGEFARAKYLGKAVKSDIIRLEVNLDETKYLMNPETANSGPGIPATLSNAYYNFGYTFQPDEIPPNGIPQGFTHTVTGLTNRILVEINESQLASSYDITIKPAGTTEVWKTVQISAKELAASNYFVNISRKTLDKTGLPIGFIPAGSYDVQVYANGTLYNYPVITKSATNGTTEMTVPVSSPSSGSFPSNNSTFSVRGSVNNIVVNISEAYNLEYYSIRITGPLNYPSAVTTWEATGYPGSNVIKIDNPAVTIGDPGVYMVEVFGVNELCYSGENINWTVTPSSSTGTQYTSVVFDKYIKQKLETAATSSSFQNLGALDLEVNFNDGSGWYRLKLASDDNSLNEREIDCRFNSYMEQNIQKFYVTFMPPAGNGTGIANWFKSIFNIFFGGREETDVYIRTVADPKYKEAFWLKSQSAFISGSADPYVKRSPAIIADPSITRDQFVSAWTNSPYSDITKFEDSINSLYRADPMAVPTSGFYLSSNVKSDYLFSPAESRMYRIKASFISDFTPTQASELTDPIDFTATAGDGCIYLTGISSRLADTFVVYWRSGDSAATGGEDITNTSLWQRSFSISKDLSGSDVLGTSDYNPLRGTYHYKITGLAPNQRYIAAVVAENNLAISQPKFTNVLIPYKTTVSPIPPTFALNLGVKNSDGKYPVYVTGITASGECRYKVYYKTEAEANTAWHMIDTYSANDPGTVVYSPTTVTIPNVNSWEHLQVKVCSVTLGNVEGVMSDVQSVNVPNANFINPGVNKIYLGTELICSQYLCMDLSRYQVRWNSIIVLPGVVNVKIEYWYNLGSTPINNIMNYTQSTSNSVFYDYHDLINSPITNLRAQLSYTNQYGEQSISPVYTYPNP